MAAITVNQGDDTSAVRVLEDVTITNQTANSASVTKAFTVPSWALVVSFYIFYDSATGTSPLFDFVVGIPDFGSSTRIAAPTDDNDALLGNAGWNGITQVTGAGPYQIVVNIGPSTADDDTGSATASSTYGVQTELPPWLYYTYTTDGTTDDEDYRFRIVVQFRS